MKQAVSGIFSKTPKNPNSHVRGWASVWADNLNVPLITDPVVVETLYLDHGANHTGNALNLFGGFTQDLKDRIDVLMKCDNIVSLDKECPDYGASLRNRKDVKALGLVDWCDALSEKLKTATTLVSSDLPLDWLAVGDSHTAAYSRKNSAVVKQDGTTLFGQIREDFGYIRKHASKKSWEGITLSLSNIDIRHHVCRHGDDSMYRMLDSFVSFINSLEMKVEVSAPWPIEFEERRMPKTGQYKGTNFYGSLSERQLVVGKWIGYLEEKGINLVKPPQEWYYTDPKLYAETYMERPQSVHLNPMYYRRCNWGIPSNTLESFFP